MIPCVQGTPNCVNGLLGLSAGPGYDLTTGLGSVDAEIARHRLEQRHGEFGEGGGGSSVGRALGHHPSHRDGQRAGRRHAAHGHGELSCLNLYDLPLGTADISVYNGVATATMTFPASAVILDDGSVTAIYSGDKNYNSSAAGVTVTYKQYRHGFHGGAAGDA